MQGPLSSRVLRQYLSRLKDGYARLMTITPDQFECFYDKDRSIISSFNLLKNAIQEYSIDAIGFLTLSSFFGKNEISIAVLATQNNHEDDLTIDLIQTCGTHHKFRKSLKSFSKGGRVERRISEQGSNALREVFLYKSAFH